jgi:hypothetical protein
MLFAQLQKGGNGEKKEDRGGMLFFIIHSFSMK